MELSTLREVGVKEGPIMAAADKFNIKVRGVGGHGAAPQGTVDSIIVASHLVQALPVNYRKQKYKPIDSAVITIGKINGGNNFNVIADEVDLIGTVEHTQKKIENY